MSSSTPYPLPFACLLLVLLSSCTTAKKNSQSQSDGGILHAVSANDPLTEETIEELKAIAEHPASSLDEEEVAEQIPLAPELAETHTDPAKAWARPGLNPRSISPGDVFSENDGSVLNKTFSLSDSLPVERRKTLFHNFTSVGTMQVPMTISRGEIAELQQMAQDISLPTRSVAVDFRTTTYSADSAKLEALYDDLERGTEIEGLGTPPAELREQLAEIKRRLKSGEKLFVVTGVTESNQLKATYPGAPVGRRDAIPIRNAVQQMFPHLDGLESTKEDKAIILSGKPRVLWEFEARELKLDSDRLVIDSQALVQL